MRDPARIDPAVERLRAAWKANPDLRLGQLVFNAAHAARALTPPCPPLFYMEDAELLDALDPAGWMCDVCGCWNPRPGRCKYHDEEHERYEDGGDAQYGALARAAAMQDGHPQWWSVTRWPEGLAGEVEAE